MRFVAAIFLASIASIAAASGSSRSPQVDGKWKLHMRCVSSDCKDSTESLFPVTMDGALYTGLKDWQCNVERIFKLEKTENVTQMHLKCTSSEGYLVSTIIFCRIDRDGKVSGAEGGFSLSNKNGSERTVITLHCE